MQNVDKTFIACFQQCSNPNTIYKPQQPQREAKAPPPSVQTPPICNRHISHRTTPEGSILASATQPTLRVVASVSKPCFLQGRRHNTKRITGCNSHRGYCESQLLGWGERPAKESIGA